MAEGYKTLFVPREQYNIVKLALARIAIDSSLPATITQPARDALTQAEAMEIEFKTI